MKRSPPSRRSVKLCGGEKRIMTDIKLPRGRQGFVIVTEIDPKVKKNSIALNNTNNNNSITHPTGY